MGHIAIAVDSSGSVSDTDFNSFVSEISYLLNKYKPTNISLITFDTEIKSINEIKNNNELSKVQFVGRDGTDVLDLWNWIKKNKPVFTLVYTDGEFHKHDLTVKSPIVWIIHNNKQFTYKGKVVHYDL